MVSRSLSNVFTITILYLSLVVNILIYSLLMFDLCPQMPVKSNLFEINKCGKSTFPMIQRDCCDSVLKYSMLIYRGRIWITTVFEGNWIPLRIRLGHFCWTKEKLIFMLDVFLLLLFSPQYFSLCFSPKSYVQVKTNSQ